MTSTLHDQFATKVRIVRLSFMLSDAEERRCRAKDAEERGNAATLITFIKSDIKSAVKHLS